MFDSVVQEPSLLGGDFADQWRTNRRILDLEDELGRTQHELEVLRESTAQMLTAILTKMEMPSTPAGAAAPEIRKLADLWKESSGDPADDPIMAEIEKMEADHENMLACLDRRFRWFPARAK